MFGLKKIFGFEKQPVLTVDFNQLPILPNGTIAIKDHKPAGTGVMTLTKESFLLLQMPPYVPYDEYRHQHIDEPLGDTLILDSFIDLLKQNGKSWEQMVHKTFGIKQGQIFFLGTTYEGENRKEVVSFLNINTDMPALRYACPIKDVIRWDFPLYSCQLI